MQEARYRQFLENEYVRCLLCPQNCRLRPGQRGVCITRKNEAGTLVTENYGQIVSLALDPIEKKPLYHFRPGTQILSTGPNGCNLKCAFCQNCDISQATTSTQGLSPESLARAARNQSSIGIAYTYTEPFIWFEYLMEVMPLVRSEGLKNVLVSNAYINPEPLKELLPFVDAMNLDIKSMDPSFYKRLCKGSLDPVLKTCETAGKSCHIEITNLLITGINDSDEWISGLVDYVADSLGADTPLHFSRYFPRYRLDRPPTSPERMEAALSIGRSRLRYVYAGNISLGTGSDSVCDKCGAILVRRSGYATEIGSLRDGRCADCGTRHAFVD